MGAAELLGERPASRVWPEIRPKYAVSVMQRSPSSTAFSIILICKLVPAEQPSVPTNTTVSPGYEKLSKPSWPQNYTEGVTYDNVPFPKESLAALANVDVDFPGSCGRCYEVRCKNGLVLANGTQIFNTTQGYSLPAHAPNATDDYGRQ